jgi:alpha-amylase
MPQVCFYFLLHQPYRLRPYDVSELGQHHNYFNSDTYDQNKEVFIKVANKSYRPMLKLLLKLVETVPDFKFSFSTSGVFLEQAQEFAPDVIELLQKLSAYPEQVEILAENYYHSLAALYSEREFFAQVEKHQKLIKKLFNAEPKIFRNTELIFNNHVASLAAKLGYKGILSEGVDKHLTKGTKTQVWRSQTQPSIPVLLKHAVLSDDIAFRFSQKSWESWPLTAEKYQSWISMYDQDQYINLFMDFETFGEHQWEDTGIFEFFEEWVKLFLKYDFDVFVTPSEEARVAQIGTADYRSWLSNLPIYNIIEPISWADEHRDLSAWRSNSLQEDALNQIYALEALVKSKDDPVLLEDWQRLLVSDHFYYMCTKYSADGDVHAYFSAYNSPFEAYRRYCVILADLTHRVKFAKPKKTLDRAIILPYG